MKVLITGIAGFVGSTLATELATHDSVADVFGIDNLSRRGSQVNFERLRKLGVYIRVGDIRNMSDVDSLPDFDWLIDAAANPSVLAGADGTTSSRQLMEHNLLGTINMLERCKAIQAGFTLLSTSRVYSIKHLADLQLVEKNSAFALINGSAESVVSRLPPGISTNGINEHFSTTAPISLYGATKLASEQLALEYGLAFDFPVWINRCGVMAGAGQFGKPDQGIFAYWIHSFREGKPLKYIGFGGSGHQVRDCLHPQDLVPLIAKQIQNHAGDKPRIVNVSGGLSSAMSLAQLTDWCIERFPNSSTVEYLHNATQASSSTERNYDLPWVVLDSTLAHGTWNWSPQKTTPSILSEIADFAERQPNWISLSS